MSQPPTPPQDDYEWQSPQQRRPRRLEEAESTEVGFPIAWVLIGGLAGLITIGLIGLGIVNIVRKQSITPTPGLPGLAQTVEATPPTSVGTTPVVPPETPPAEAPGGAPGAEATPTNTPVVAGQEPTEAPAPPGEIQPGGFVKVVGTQGAGLSMRAGPGTNNARLGLAEDDTVLEVIDGPREDENLQSFIWWFVRHPDGTEGWVVQDFVEPAAPPPE
ncbi:MAG: SH3 domain-containing protein [Anaerolineae bacterium]